MRKVSSILRKCPTTRVTRRFYSSSPKHGYLTPIPTIDQRFEDVDVNEFRQRAFDPEIPIHITNPDPLSSPIPAATKWFSFAPENHGGSNQALIPSEYLALYSKTILPYELVEGGRKLEGNDVKSSQKPSNNEGTHEMLATLTELIQDSPEGTFHRFNAPLSLFLEACRDTPRQPYRLYIAQAQIADLPKQLQDDLPTPRLVKEAGRGDVYDSNIWIGLPPTYTPLHKDPNPNLFVQLASSKRVRLFRPSVGHTIFRDVQFRIGQSSSARFRGEEMMEGPERDALNEAVWGHPVLDGFEAIISPGDALFIPKGWWHSIKSIGTNITASVNWWFR